MRDHTVVLEEGIDAMPGTVDELVDDDHVSRMNVLFHRADGGDAEDLLRPGHLERQDVRPIVDPVRREADALGRDGARKASRVLPIVPGDDRIGGRPERGRQLQLFHVSQLLELVEPASSDDAECSLDAAHLV